MRDIGTPNTTLIRTRVELPGGSVAVHGGVIEGHLVGWGIPYESHNVATFEMNLATIRDFGQERREASIAIAPPPTLPVTPPGVQPWVLLKHTGVVNNDATDPVNGSVTTPAIDTGGATLIIAAVSTDDTTVVTATPISDSRGNVWTLAYRFPTGPTGGGNGCRCDLWYTRVANGTSIAHTFTAKGPLPGISVLVFKGGPGSQLDVFAGATVTGVAFGVTTPAITPVASGALVITALSMGLPQTPGTIVVGSGFTDLEERQAIPTRGLGISMGYQSQAVAAPISANWTYPAHVPSTAVIVAFLPVVQGDHPLVPTLRTIAPLRDLGAASVAALQIEFSDRLIDEQWALDQLVLRVRREEDR